MIQFEIENELITQEELEEFEQQLDGLKLPEDYKAHMLKYNGGITIEDYICGDNENIKFMYFLPIKYGSDTMENSLIAREDVLPINDIYIGAVRGGELCMSLGENNGSIYVFYSDGERIDLASSFTEFINGLSLM
ncbi:hypothetical protein GCM10011344_24940 [Dokdonia pacifica]|uniref:SMI1 / KNR4 family (SUKH-1) n=1 Tax=Dokdonia pacifica TaxID=1627892 RepID=A0A238WQN6_9FLAO|nr:SMI1/KNR4 family protein [Dokdonia pacifica]GGG23214.1 hypothetical protein GCM10011344_24940 [Dokdonia pacifica]SNR48718.1 SMI1 / KNR4 family (SUKH-1) [Dokdonia pacifica]